MGINVNTYGTRSWAICMHAVDSIFGERTNSCVYGGKTFQISAGTAFSSLASVNYNYNTTFQSNSFAGYSVASLISSTEARPAFASTLLAIFPKEKSSLAARVVVDNAFQGLMPSEFISVLQNGIMVSALPYTGRKPESTRKGGEA